MNLPWVYEDVKINHVTKESTNRRQRQELPNPARTTWQYRCERTLKQIAHEQTEKKRLLGFPIRFSISDRRGTETGERERDDDRTECGDINDFRNGNASEIVGRAIAYLFLYADICTFTLTNTESRG
ncbi:hypothetical protein BHM03_00054853 [Ensete ventricosum]|nr:hypothetical protein BHM03_00054853 [Ensete ventricosum]